MSERKVLNKYYPIDFEFYKLPKLELPKDRQYVVRLMAPFTMRCNTCGEYIYKGRKFNARKETVKNEKYLGIPIFRFYIKCTRCLSEITFKTDPKNTDYAPEHGAVRTFQAEKLAEQQVLDQQREKEEEEANDPMLALEHRTRDSKREMDVLDALEEIRDQNARFEQVDLNAILKHYQDEEKLHLEKQEHEDEELVQSIFHGSSIVKRLDDNNSSEDEERVPSKDQSASLKRPSTDFLVDGEVSSVQAKKKKFSTRTALSALIKKHTNDSEGNHSPAEVTLSSVKPSTTERKTVSTGLGLVGSYSDSDSTNSND